MSQPQCTAKSKGSGQRCRKRAMVGTTVCRNHGGVAALKNRGAGSPNYKDGKYSKYLPHDLAATYQRSRHDPRLLELREDISLVDALIGDALQRMEGGGGMEQWTELHAVVGALRVAAEDKDHDRIRQGLDRLGRLTSSGVAAANAMGEVLVMVQQRRKLVEAETRISVQMQHWLPPHKAMALMNSVASIVLRHVPDDATRSRISHEISRLAGTADSPEPDC